MKKLNQLTQILKAGPKILISLVVISAVVAIYQNCGPSRVYESLVNPPNTSSGTGAPSATAIVKVGTNLAIGNKGAQAEPKAIKSADFRGLGRKDLAVVSADNINNGGGHVSVFLSNGDGTFQPQVIYPVGATPTSLAVGDFNGDGKSDIAVSNFNSNDVTILIGNGDGTFRTPYAIGGFFTASGITTGDFNGDRKLDLAVGGNGSLAIYMGNGDGTFKPAVLYPVQAMINDLDVGDLDGDGKLDIAMIDNNNELGVFRGNGDGTFAKQTSTVSPSWWGGQISLVDLNGDGKLDAVVADNFNQAIYTFLGNGDRTFQPFVKYNTAFSFSALAPHSHSIETSGAFSFALGDVNGDGKPDIVVGGYQGGRGILLGNGDGTFQNIKAVPGIWGGPMVLTSLTGNGNLDWVSSEQDHTANVGISFANGDGTFNDPP